MKETIKKERANLVYITERNMKAMRKALNHEMKSRGLPKVDMEIHSRRELDMEYVYVQSKEFRMKPSVFASTRVRGYVRSRNKQIGIPINLIIKDYNNEYTSAYIFTIVYVFGDKGLDSYYTTTNPEA